MSSRQEEKEKRKQERLAREAAAAAAAKRKRLLQLIGGVVVACAIVAGGAFALAGGGEDDGDDIDNAELSAAAKKAGCEYRSFPNYGQEHESKEFTAADYKTNPPTSGAHLPPGLEAQAGLYIAGNEPKVGAWVHTLEHGRILFQYRPGSKPNVVRRPREALQRGRQGQRRRLPQRPDAQQHEDALPVGRRRVAPLHDLPGVHAAGIEAFREFRTALVDKAPELVP